MKTKSFLFILVYICMQSLYAGDIAFEINRNDRLIQNILNEIKSDLSDKFKSRIPQKIKVLFKDLNKRSLSEINCQENVVVGRAYRGTIEIDNVFLKEMNKGDRPLVNCIHSTVKKYMKATIVHELAHLYDEKEKVSKDPLFLNIAGWVSKGLLIHKRVNLNQNDERSPDRYEFKNKKESFAVNLEHFLYDANYKCRKPIYYEFYSRELNLIPNQNTNCEATNKIPGYNGDGIKEFKDFNIESLYEVHYLMAGKGDAAMSRFGHSMFRLVMCAPGKEKGPSCLQDVSYHLVLSFRGSIATGVVNTMDGVTGKYPSELFIESFFKTVNEYTKGELREVFSLPIHFSEEQLERFAERTKEIVWGYSGKYYFFTNNCATESLNLIRVASGEEEDKLQTVNINTPKGIYKYLVKTGMGNDSVFNNKKEAQLKGYYYPSAAEKVKTSLAYFNIGIKNLKDFMNKYNTKQRRALYLNLIEQSSEKMKAAGNALRIEDLIYEHKSIELKEMFLTDAYNKKSANYEKLAIFRKELAEVSSVEKSINNLNHEYKTYGIPLSKEIVENVRDLENEQISDEKSLVIKNILKELYGNEISKVDEIGATKIMLKKILLNRK